MDVVLSHCAGLDVHKRTVVACCLITGPEGALQRMTRTFSTHTADLLALADWLSSLGVTHVAMESTAEYWKPLYNLLEASFTVLVVNAQHIKTVPGRKTDVKDAEWIADLLRHGLLKASFIPLLPQRDLRDLTRQRTNLVQDRARVVNQLQKVLEWANIKLSSVVTDITGVSARAMLQALIEGQEDPDVLADLARGQLRKKRDALAQALVGRFREHHRFLLTQHLLHLECLEEQIASFDEQIIASLTPDETSSVAVQPEASAPAVASCEEPLSGAAAIELLDTIPGVGRGTAELLVAEVGTDMRRFPSAAHLMSWAKVCPGNRESAGKRYSGRTGSGNRWLRAGLIQAAHAAVKVKDSYFARVYHRLAGRRGAKRAIMAVAHRLLIAVYHMLLRHEPYREPSLGELDAQHKARVLDRVQRRVEQLGYRMSLEPLPSAVT